jgi:hypothetical protein
MATMLGDKTLPAETAYHNDYTTISQKKVETLLAREWWEPASGTGNYIATIQYYRLRYAVIAAGAVYIGSKTSLEDNPRNLPFGSLLTPVTNFPLYHRLILQTIGTFKTNDISPSNLQVVKRRLLSIGNEPVNSESLQEKYASLSH